MFKIKNLMVKVSPEGEQDFCGKLTCKKTTCIGASACPLPSLCDGCTGTECGCTHNCSACSQSCTHCTDGCTGTGKDLAVEASGADCAARRLDQLGELKSRLRSRLSHIEQEEKILSRGLAPQTLEEIEAVEAKLDEAKAELEQQKARLSDA